VANSNKLTSLLILIVIIIKLIQLAEYPTRTCPIRLTILFVGLLAVIGHAGLAGYYTYIITSINSFLIFSVGD